MRKILSLFLLIAVSAACAGASGGGLKITGADLAAVIEAAKGKPAPVPPAKVDPPVVAVPVVEVPPAPEPAPRPLENLNVVVFDSLTGAGINGASCIVNGDRRLADGSGFINYAISGPALVLCSAAGYLSAPVLELSPGDRRVPLVSSAPPAPVPVVVSPGGPAAAATYSIDRVVELIKRIHDAEGVNLGAASSREARNAFFERAIGLIHFGSSKYGIGADPRWCVKDGGNGRPMSDDVVALCATREAWDTIPGAGAEGYRFHADALGVLPAVQNVYPPRRPR